MSALCPGPSITSVKFLWMIMKASLWIFRFWRHNQPILQRPPEDTKKADMIRKTSYFRHAQRKCHVYSWTDFPQMLGEGKCHFVCLFYRNGVKVECLHFLSTSLMWLQAPPMHVRRPRLCSCGRSFLSDWPTSWRKLISSLTSSSALHP